MKDDVRLRREICRIVIAMSAGEASEQQHARLEELIRTNPAARGYVVDALTQMSDLEWEVREGFPAIKSIVAGHAEEAPAATHVTPITVAPRRPRSPWISQWRIGGSVAGAFSLGVAAALAVMFRLGFERQHDVFVVDSIPRADSAAVARLVSNTSFLIDSDAGSAIKAGDAIHAGKSVTLFDGVAEVEFENAVSVRLKGPALMSIDDAGEAHMKYGRLIVTNHGNRPFRLQLPVATTDIAPDSYVGIDGHDDDVFVYTFEGKVNVTSKGAVDPSVIVASKGIRIRRNARSAIVLQPLEADSKAFDFDLLMASDQIDVSQQYVDRIVAAQPIGYWRFEEADLDQVQNEMGPAHPLSVEGDGVRIVPREGNGVAEFVIRDEAASLVAREPFDEMQGDYTVELWVKPSHFQWGTLAALIARDFDNQGEIDRHAMLVELHGANAPPEGRAKSIRFLHRSPPSDQAGGSSCFSSAFYRAQVWQHVAAVKREGQVELYINGELVASAPDPTKLPAGLHLVVGQLFSFGTVRPFVGHIDELAIYDRALSIEEIRQHVATMREAPSPETATTEPAVETDSLNN